MPPCRRCARCGVKSTIWRWCIRNTPWTPRSTSNARCAEHVAEGEEGMEPRHVGHVMGVQRAGQDLQEHPRADVEQGEDVGDGEAAAGPLAGGLAEMGLELGGVGHRGRGAIDDEDAMPEPASGVAGGGEERIGDAADQALEDHQRQAGPGQAVGGGGKHLPGQMG